MENKLVTAHLKLRVLKDVDVMVIRNFLKDYLKEIDLFKLESLFVEPYKGGSML